MRSPSLNRACYVLLCYLILLGGADCYAQSLYSLSNRSALHIKEYDALPDSGFSFSQILQQPALSYSADSVSPQKSTVYWVKLRIENPYPDDEEFFISLWPLFNYTVYYPDSSGRRWKSQKAGLAVSNAYRRTGIALVRFEKQTSADIYLKIDLSDFRGQHVKFKPTITLRNARVLYNDDQMQAYFILVCCLITLSFLFYNLYIYFSLKDKACLYLVVIQIGSIIFLPATRGYFNVLLPFRQYAVRALNNGDIVYYDLNNFFQHIGVLLIFGGLIQFTRTYLLTWEFLPSYDRVLRYTLYAYVASEIIPAVVTLSGLFYLDDYTIVFANYFVQLIVLLTIVTAIVAYKKKVRAAKYFLLANLLPMMFTVAASVHVTLTREASTFLPEMAIISQIFTFGIALVGRVKLINKELREKEKMALELETNIQASEYKRLLIEQENKYISRAIKNEQDKNSELQGKLEANQRELVGNSVYMHQKNKLLATLETQIRDIDHLYPHLKHGTVKGIQQNLKESQHLDSEWDKFKLHFEQVHPRFFEQLHASSPSLTQNEMRMAAYFHIKLSTKEIATLLNIQPASVRQAKMRLKAKIKGEL